VLLPDAPIRLALSADGLRAAVLHTGKITIVNLATAQIEKLLTAVVDGTNHIVLGPENVYALPDKSIRIATGAVTTSPPLPLPSSGIGPVLHPNGQWVYSPSLGRVSKFDISTGQITHTRDSAYEARISPCGLVRYIAGATRIATGCGTVLQTSADPAVDMWGVASMGSPSNFKDIADAAALQRIAAVPHATNQSPNADTELEVYETSYFARVGRRTMPSFGSGTNSRPAHIQRVFFSADASFLMTVVFATDPLGGPQYNGVVVMPASASGAACEYTLSKSAVAVSAEGVSDQVSVTTRPDCISEATTTSGWIRLASPTWAGGNITYKFLVEANSTSSARSGSISFAPGKSVTVVQAGAAASPAMITALPYKPVRTEFSPQLNRLVSISDDPPLLHIHDPANGAGAALALRKIPVSLSVSRDGKFAAVGHDGLITYVNVSTATVQQEFRVPYNVAEVALAPQGFVHFTSFPEYLDLATLAMATGAITTSDILGSTYGRLQIAPGGGFLYVLSQWPTKWDIRAGLPTFVSRGPLYEVCGPLEFTPDGFLAYDQCGRVLYTNDKPVQDPVLKLTLQAGFSGIAYSAPLRRLAFLLAWDGKSQVTPPELLLVDETDYEIVGALTMPEYPGTTATAEARSIFWSPDSSKLYTVIKARGQAAVANDHAVYTITPGQPGPWCTFAISSAQANVPATGGAALLNVTTSASCTWRATSSAPWLRVIGGSPGYGPELIGYSVEVNPTTTVRTATITVGTATFSVTQAAGSSALCNFAVTPSTISAAAANRSGTLQLAAAAPSCSWTASSSASWAQVYPLAGAGPASISYTIFPNFTTLERTATLTAGGKTVTITQAGATGTLNERFVKLLYFNLLGRMPTPAEISLQVTAIQTSSRVQLAANFFNSAEFNLGGRFIAGLYVGLLNRDAEYSGYLFQRNAMLSGAIAQTTLVSNFMASAEYGLRYGNPSNSEFVRLLYRHILLREAGQTEVDFHTGNLQAGMTRVTLASNFLNTKEFREGTQARLNAFLVFASLLMRGPNPTEHAARIEELLAGKTIPQMIEEITTSREFTNLMN
jgi:hypothetical protein